MVRLPILIKGPTKIESIMLPLTSEDIFCTWSISFCSIALSFLLFLKKEIDLKACQVPTIFDLYNTRTNGDKT